MRLLSLLVRNFELSHNLSDLLQRSQFRIELGDESQNYDDWLTKLSNRWITTLETVINTLSEDRKEKLGITENIVQEMNIIINDYYKAQKGLNLSLKEFSEDYPTLLKSYSRKYEEEEFVKAQFDTLYIQADLANNNDKFVLSGMIVFDNNVANNYIDSLPNDKIKNEARMHFLEKQKFPFSLDVSQYVDNKIKPLATFNNFHESKILPKHNNVKEMLTEVLNKDYEILSHYLEKSISIIDYMDKHNFIESTLSQCRHDSLLNGVTDESLIFFKEFTEEKILERELRKNPIDLPFENLKNKLKI